MFKRQSARDRLRAKQQQQTNWRVSRHNRQREQRHDADLRYELKLHSAETMDRWDRLQGLRHSKGSYQQRRRSLLTRR